MFFVIAVFVLLSVAEGRIPKVCELISPLTVIVNPIEVGIETSITFAVNATCISPRCRSRLLFNNKELQNFYLINNTQFFLHFVKVNPTDFGNYTLFHYKLNVTGSCESYQFEVTQLQPSFWTDFLQLYIWPVVSGVVVLVVIILVACLARCKTNNLEKKIDELRDLTEEQARKMKYAEKMNTFDNAELDQTSSMPNTPNGQRPNHLEVQSTPSYPPPSPPVNTRQQKKSPTNRTGSHHFYDQCQPVKDRPPFPPPASARDPENPMYDTVAPDENLSRPVKFVRSVKSLVKGNSRKFGQQFGRKYGNISAINIPAFKVVSHSAQHANSLPNYDDVEFEPEPATTSTHY